jgi:hypothetical protein
MAVFAVDENEVVALPQAAQVGERAGCERVAVLPEFREDGWVDRVDDDDRPFAAAVDVGEQVLEELEVARVEGGCDGRVSLDRGDFLGGFGLDFGYLRGSRWRLCDSEGSVGAVVRGCVSLRGRGDALRAEIGSDLLQVVAAARVFRQPGGDDVRGETPADEPDVPAFLLGKEVSGVASEHPSVGSRATRHGSVECGVPGELLEERGLGLPAA